MVENFKGSLEVAVDSFNQGGLAVVGGSREMGHAPSKTEVVEHSAAENTGVVSDNGAGRAVCRKERTFQTLAHRLGRNRANPTIKHKFRERVKNDKNRDVAALRAGQWP